MNTRIHDLPPADRPREKLARLGPTVLDNAELIALFLSTGTKGRSAISIGRDLISKYGSISALGGLSVSQLAAENGLGPAKASKLAAAFELGARAANEQIQQVPLDEPALIHRFMSPRLAHLSQEQVVVTLVNSRLRHIASITIAVGSVSDATAHPREVLRPVITRGAFGFILVHNHPSGDPTPSHADEKATRRLIEAAGLLQVRFIDHLIIGRPSPGRPPYFSFREAGVIS